MSKRSLAIHWQGDDASTRFRRGSLPIASHRRLGPLLFCHVREELQLHRAEPSGTDGPMTRVVICVSGSSKHLDRDRVRELASRTGLTLTTWDPTRRAPREFVADLVVATGDPVLAADLAVDIDAPLALAPQHGVEEWLSQIDSLAVHRAGVLRVRLDRRRDRFLYGAAAIHGSSAPVTTSVGQERVSAPSVNFCTGDPLGLAIDVDGPPARGDELVAQWYTTGRWSRRLLERKSVVTCRSARAGEDLVVSGDGGRVRAVARSVTVSPGPRLRVAQQ